MAGEQDGRIDRQGHFVEKVGMGTEIDAGMVQSRTQRANFIGGVQVVYGHLIVTLSDGTTYDVGQVGGPAGRGIASVGLNDAGHLITVYTDGTTSDAGYAVGAAGKDAVPSIKAIASATVTNTAALAIGASVDLTATWPSAWVGAYKATAFVSGTFIGKVTAAVTSMTSTTATVRVTNTSGAILAVGGAVHVVGAQ